jgi:hypothetical protein
MNGHIWVTNSEEGGAKFHFCFPEADRQTITTAGQAEAVMSLTQTPLSGSSALDIEKAGALRVLLLDDSCKYRQTTLLSVKLPLWQLLITHFPPHQ